MSALDQHNVTFEQSNRAALTGLIGVFLTDFGGLIYAAGGNAETDKIITAGWTLELKREPNLRIVIHAEEPKLFNAARDTLRALGHTVNSMRDLRKGVDYLVALV